LIHENFNSKTDPILLWHLYSAIKSQFDHTFNEFLPYHCYTKVISFLTSLFLFLPYKMTSEKTEHIPWEKPPFHFFISRIKATYGAHAFDIRKKTF